jgi:hypothetical protein
MAGPNSRSIEELKIHLMENVIENHQGCWLWRKSIFKQGDGYGQQKHDNKNWHTHRLFYTLFVGEVPDELVVRHLCGNSLCNNPLHLATGTHKENQADSVKHGTRDRWLFGQQGENNATALFTEDDVYFIRTEFREERLDVKALSKYFDCGRWAVEKVINGDNYSVHTDVLPFDWRDLDKITHFGFLTRKGYRLGRELAEKGYKIIQIQRELGIKDIQARKIFHQKYKELV